MRTGLRTAVATGFPPLLDRYVAREVTSHAFGGFAVVLGVFLVTRGSVLLSDAAVGGLPGGVLAVLLGLRTVMALPSLLPAVAYLGVLLAMNRLSRDRELIAMAATGIGPGRLERAVLGCGLCAALVVAVLSFAGRPWAAARYAEVRDLAIARSGLDDITPGVFYELRSTAREVVFAGARSATDPAYLEDVFVQRRDANGLAVFSAARAIETRDPAHGIRNLVLEDGYQYDLTVESDKQTVTRFERLAMQVPLPPREGDAEKSLTWRELFAAADPESVAELQWRAAMPIATVLLCLLAIPLGRFDPRSGRTARLFTAALAYMVYRALLGTAKSWVANGILPAAAGLWMVHGACFGVVLALAWRQRRAAG
ncbi:MAG: LPS export ABC transporter permease LptF [Deltaproteobacteria bacterium]|nr:LPS export ABC transporter permease LptF [Deltaproteobacteria bacterium]